MATPVGVAPTIGRARRAQLVSMIAAVLAGTILRWWALGSSLPTFDEAFTAAYSRLPVADLLSALRHEDSHPPLDYLLRKLVVGTSSTFWLRAPSAAAATIALLVVAAWMWRRGWFGVLVTGVSAFSSFQILYAHQARMYAPMILFGTVCAASAERWLAAGSPPVRAPGSHGPAPGTWRWIAGVSVLLAMFSHVSGALLALGLVLVAGVRTDREAWFWRGTIGVAVATWTALWGPAFLDQRATEHASWIPLTTPAELVRTVGGLITMYDGMTWLVAVLLVAGGAALLSVDARLARVWLAMFVLPIVVLALLGMSNHILLSRTLAMAAWAPPVALAALVEWLRRRFPAFGVGVVVAAAILLLPSVKPAAEFEEQSAPARRELEAVLRPGDAVAVHPSFFWPILTWDVGVERDSPRPAVLDLPDVFAGVPGDAAFSGRVWLLWPNTYSDEVVPLPRCVEQPETSDGDFRLTCFEVPASG